MQSFHFFSDLRLSWVCGLETGGFRKKLRVGVFFFFNVCLVFNNCQGARKEESSDAHMRFFMMVAWCFS